MNPQQPSRLGAIGSQSRCSWLRRRLTWQGFLALLGLALFAFNGTAEERILDLTPKTKLHLEELRDAWQDWTAAFAANDAEAENEALERLQGKVRRLGLRYLPDLSIAASAHAVNAAREGAGQRAQRALVAARKLDPDRPESAFAEAAIERLEGNFVGAISSGLRGYGKLLQLPLERSIWLQNTAIWVIYLLILSGAAFLALQIAVKGKDLFYDLSRTLSPPLPGPVADLLVVLVLVWPIFLPSGTLWLALYWSVLIWGYGSLSEKFVFIFLWAFVGATPLLLSYQQLAGQLRMIPPTRALDQMNSERLYGTLFSDVALLQVLLPDSLASKEVIADLHRRIGQWDQARSIYALLADNPDQKASQAAAPLSNMGLYALRHGEYETAKAYFQRATEADPRSAEAFYNLSQAYSLLYDFENAERLIAQAQALDQEKVEAWNSLDVTTAPSGVEIPGGLRRYPEIQQDLRQLWGGNQSFSLQDLWRRNFSLSILLATLLLAVTLHMVRRQLGYRSRLLEEEEPSMPAGLRAIVPGLPSALQGRGWRAFLGIALPTSLVILPLLRGIGYRTPLGLDPGQWLPTVVSVVALLVVMLIRLGWEMAVDG